MYWFLMSRCVLCPFFVVFLLFFVSKPESPKAGISRKKLSGLVDRTVCSWKNTKQRYYYEALFEDAFNFSDGFGSHEKESLTENHIN